MTSESQRDRFRIGVTGHRHMEDTAALRATIAAALERARARAPGGAPGWAIVSALAEGADRVVADIAMTSFGARLEAVLPLPPSDYERDFATPASRAEFASLLARAEQTAVMPPQGSRQDAYLAVGHYLVDHCDVLVAVWDGRPAAGKGGTADVVARARAVGRALLWVRPGAVPELREER